MLYDVVHSSVAARSADGAEALDFFYNPGGLNNQKMAIAGLFVAAIGGRLAVRMPHVHVMDQRTEDKNVANFQDVFEPDPVADFARRRDIALDFGKPSGKGDGWDHFKFFGDVLGNGSDPAIVEAVLDAMTSLRPRIAAHPIFLRLKDFVFASLGIETVIQLRIEDDWQAHAKALRALLCDTEDYGIGFVEILAKVRRTFPDLKLAYATTDEKSMPASKDEIRAFSRDRFGIDLLWKSDLLAEAELAELNSLDLSMIDFEIARYCPRFVGQTKSTFANMLCLEKFAKARTSVRGHYIYDCPGDVMMERCDNGFSSSAHRALRPSPVCGLIEGRAVA